MSVLLVASTETSEELADRQGSIKAAGGLMGQVLAAMKQAQTQAQVVDSSAPSMGSAGALNSGDVGSEAGSGKWGVQRAKPAGGPASGAARDGDEDDLGGSGRMGRERRRSWQP